MRLDEELLRSLPIVLGAMLPLTPACAALEQMFLYFPDRTLVMTPAAVPSAEALSSSTRLELSAGGGHVGFVHGPHPLRPRYWLEERIPAFLAGHVQSL